MVRAQIREFRSLYEQEGLVPRTISLFQDIIRYHYHEHGRSFPWRETHNPYHILVSEVMLQQTQASRVVNKYKEFLEAFPDFAELAQAPLKDVLRIWQGLGYNRRALALRQTAREVAAQLDGRLPSDPEALQRLPGIGPYTAAAVAAIAFNRPTVFIETNIRTVFLSFFFNNTAHVTDRDIVPLIEATLDQNNPREWYYALFDYGAMIKRHQKDAPGTPYHVQSAFKGSTREVRGNIIRLLLSRESIPEQELFSLLDHKGEQVKEILRQLHKEGFIDIAGDVVRIR
jgi:A/G-specific adenine glycosylase